MRTQAIVLVLAVAFAKPLVAQENPDAEAVFAAALDTIRQNLQGAPPVNLHHKRDSTALPKDAIVVARRTIGGAPAAYRKFLDKWFGLVIAEELLQSYGDNGPASRMIDQEFADGYSVLPLESFEIENGRYDWVRLNEKYPGVRHVLRLSWPAVDRLGTYAVVRYELIGRDRPVTLKSNRPWQHASFVKFEKQPDGSWERTIASIGSLWD